MWLKNSLPASSFHLISHVISNAKYKLWRQFIQLHLTVSAIIVDIIFSSARCFSRSDLCPSLDCKRIKFFRFITAVTQTVVSTWFEAFRRIVLLPSSEKLILPWICRQRLKNPLIGHHDVINRKSTTRICAHKKTSNFTQCSRSPCLFCYYENHGLIYPYSRLLNIFSNFSNFPLGFKVMLVTFSGTIAVTCVLQINTEIRKYTGYMWSI
jgi:hypothetical protein